MLLCIGYGCIYPWPESGKETCTTQHESLHLSQPGYSATTPSLTYIGDYHMHACMTPIQTMDLFYSMESTDLCFSFVPVATLENYIQMHCRTQ